jgi:acetate kinase
VRILVVNPGSSSLKLRVLAADGEVALQRDLPSLEGKAELDTLTGFLDEASVLDAAGVRVVHGGQAFKRSVRVDAAVLDRLKSLSALAPLHNPPAVAALQALLRLRPQLPLVACFDTAFHAHLPAAAATYAVPRRWTEEWGVRRYGFHGLSHAYASRRAAELLGRDPGALRLVTCHLGAGASLAAVRDGASVDTTMGFTPMEGLVMATRSGSVDPGAILWVQRQHGLGVEEVERELDRESGLAGLTGTADMRQVLEQAAAGKEQSRRGLDVYLHRLRAGIAAMATATGGLDGVVFTGGVGENAAEIRGQACDGLGFLGLAIDEAKNRDTDGRDADVSARGAATRVLVVHAREDLEIAREVQTLLSG